MPRFSEAASSRRWKLQGPILIQVLATPMIGHRKSSSVKPIAFNVARAGARLGPSVIAVLLHFVLLICPTLPFVAMHLNRSNIGGQN